MAAISRTPTPPCSPTMQPICDVNIFIVSITDSYDLESLFDSMTIYSEQVKAMWIDPKSIPETVNKFCEELDKWLADYKTEKLSVKEVLQSWRDKVDELNAETGADLPEILIDESNQ